MMHLGIDFDDTLLDTRRVFLTILNREFGTAHSYDALQDYYLASTWGCTSDDLDRIFCQHFDELHALDPLHGVSETLQRARAARHRLTIITARPTVHMPPVYEWLARHQIIVDNVVSAPKSGEKALRAAENGIDLFVDDNPRHAVAISTRNIPVLLIDRPYNKQCQGNLITRVSNWDAIAGKLFGHLQAILLDATAQTPDIFAVSAETRGKER